MEPLDKFRHDVGSYERPNYPYRCGRALRWGKPCWQGPGIDGKCGGVAECTPLRRGGSYECQRPANAGGTCTEGPQPDGRCAHHHPPCVPRMSLRRLRGVYTVLACGVMVALIAAFSNFAGQSPVASAALNPGALSSIHAGATSNRGCVSCHSTHDKSTVEWFVSAFFTHDQTERCLDCHVFGGPPTEAHNRIFLDRRDLEKHTCAACHVEHKGADFDLKKVADIKCGACHKKIFTDFARGHVAFSAEYPYSTPNVIRYDHLGHENKSQDPRLQAKFQDHAPSQCSACHKLEPATKEIKTVVYEDACASCHDAGIKKQELVLFDQADPGDLTAMLSDISQQRETSTGTAEDLLHAMAKTKFTTEFVKRAEAALASGKTYDFLRDTEPKTGWWTDETSIRYRPKGHSDPLIKAWIMFARDQYAQTADNTQKNRAMGALNVLLDHKEGPGACAKCHAVDWTQLDAKDATPLQWTRAERAGRPNTFFNHDPHIDRLDPNASCVRCHKLNKDANYGAYFESRRQEKFISNYVAITKDTCSACHAPGLVEHSCQTCHVYHAQKSPESLFKVGAN